MPRVGSGRWANDPGGGSGEQGPGTDRLVGKHAGSSPKPGRVLLRAEETALNVLSVRHAGAAIQDDGLDVGPVTQFAKQ